MPHFVLPSGVTTPFGRNEYLRSTRGMLLDSFTMDAATHPSVTVDNFPQKVLQPGTLLAMATSGPNSGKVGVFMAGLTDGRQTVANVVGVDNTFLPTQLMDGDAEVAALYGGVVEFSRCIEYNAAGQPIALTTATRDALYTAINAGGGSWAARCANLIFDL